MPTLIEFVCAQCGERFTQPLGKSRTRRFCSVRCMGLSNRGRHPPVLFGGQWFYRGVNGYWQSRPANQLLHRAVWEATFGPIPDGLQVHHADGDKGNNDPANLRLLTAAEHSRHHDTLARRRVVRGAGVGTARLDEERVGRIKAALRSGATRGGLAREFGVSLRTVQFIANGTTWRHVE